MTHPPHVALVILTWNGKDHLLHCLSTLPRIQYPNWSATVIDNHSADDTVEALRQAYPAQRILVMEKNLGFCGGNNRGIRDALERGADYVLLLNNDIEMHPELIDELISVAESDARIGAVGAKNIMMTDHSKVWGAYGVLDYGPHLVKLIGAGQLDSAELTCVKDVDWVIGNGVMMRRSALERVGGFDEIFFGYHEDVDWCERARQAGFRIVYDGRAILYHHGSGASGPNARMPFPTMYFLGRNALVFARKHGSWRQIARFVSRFFAWVIGRCWHAWRAGERIKPYLWMVRGFIDGALGRLPLKQLGLQ